MFNVSFMVTLVAAAMENRSVFQEYNITLSDVQRFRERLQESLNLTEFAYPNLVGVHPNLTGVAACEGCQGLLQDLAVSYSSHYHG